MVLNAAGSHSHQGGLFGIKNAQNCQGNWLYVGSIYICINNMADWSAHKARTLDDIAARYNCADGSPEQCIAEGQDLLSYASHNFNRWNMVLWGCRDSWMVSEKVDHVFSRVEAQCELAPQCSAQQASSGRPSGAVFTGFAFYPCPASWIWPVLRCRDAIVIAGRKLYWRLVPRIPEVTIAKPGIICCAGDVFTLCLFKQKYFPSVLKAITIKTCCGLLILWNSNRKAVSEE